MLNFIYMVLDCAYHPSFTQHLVFNHANTWSSIILIQFNIHDMNTHHNCFTHSPIDRYLNHFQFYAMTNTDAMDILYVSPYRQDKSSTRFYFIRYEQIPIY